MSSMSFEGALVRAMRVKLAAVFAKRIHDRSIVIVVRTTRPDYER